jgi:hypothetical protein
MRYLPDLSVSLLEVVGSRRVGVNEEGDAAVDWFIDYKLKEEVRGQSAGPWSNIRFRRVVPDPANSTHTLPNQAWPEIKLGSSVLFFSNPSFDSCRVIPATASVLEIVRKTPVAIKRAEDAIPQGLQ